MGQQVQTSQYETRDRNLNGVPRVMVSKPLFGFWQALCALSYRGELTARFVAGVIPIRLGRSRQEVSGRRRLRARALPASIASTAIAGAVVFTLDEDLNAIKPVDRSRHRVQRCSAYPSASVV